ncbi:MAG: TolC family protein [Candidatus Cloacimonetes bacterium]|nr:TolC family protein [Candidatus Cloacimonadota bacterium]
MRIILNIFAILLVVNISSATEQKKIGIQEIWGHVLEWHPLVQSHQYKLISKSGEMEQASKKLNPELEFELEEFGGNKARKGVSDALFQMSYSQTFERGNKRDNRVSVSQVEKELESLENQKQLHELYFEMKEKYLETVFSRSKLELEQSLYKMTLEFENILKKLVKYGKISPLGLERAKILRSTSEIDLEDSKNEYQTAKMELFSLFNGFTKIDQYELKSLEKLPNLEKLTWDKSLVKKIINKKNDLQLEILKLEKSHAKLDHTFGGAIQNFNGNDETSFVLSYSIPLGFNDRNEGGIRAQNARVRVQEQQSKHEMLDLKKETKKLINLVSLSQKTLSKLDKIILPSSERLYTQVIKAQSAGKSDYLEVLEARKNLVESRRLHLNTKRELYIFSNQIEKLYLNRDVELQCIN